MATTTPNYGWPVPTSTDYVKDGATAIEALGDAIDATVFGLGSGALTLISTSNFTTQAAVSFNDVFDSTYTNYKILLNITTSTGLAVSFRFRNAGSDISSSNYFWHAAKSDSQTTTYGTAATANGGSSFAITATDIAAFVSGSLDVFSPAIATGKRIHGFATYFTSDRSRGGQAILGFNASAAYDGCTIFVPTGTITGNISIYGYEK
jgi:hypothetical protein